MKSIVRLYFLLLALTAALPAQDHNVVLVSIDGLRWQAIVKRNGTQTISVTGNGNVDRRACAPGELDQFAHRCRVSIKFARILRE